MLILINNKFVTQKNAKLPIAGSLGRGYGIFETLRTFGDKKLPFAEKHINRLFNSSKKIDLKITYTPEEIKTMLEKITKKSKHKTQRIKIMALEEGIIIISVRADITPKIYNGVSVESMIMIRSLPEVKSISYLPSFLAHERATKNGHFDAILTDEKGEVFEGAYSNIFWFERNKLCTRKDKILKGITRDIILKISPFEVVFKTINIKNLKKKTEVFSTQSVNLIVPITKIDKTKIGDGKPGKRTKDLQEIFKQYIKSIS